MKMKKKRNFSSENARKVSTKTLNPFEIHINRSKHQVLGRKLKSDRGLPGISKNKALQKRKKTLLQEYKMKDKSNQFIDQRIGERNSSMTEDDRIMARFAAERMRMYNKKTMFNLSDTEVLTHRGQTLSEIEKFEDIRSDDEDEEERGRSGALKGKFVGSAHFGGGTLTKTKQDRESLIDELINESKKRKAERQRNKEETLEATEQLDVEWKTLGTIVTSTKDTADVSTQKKDEYDLVMRQLKFEPHGQASQRLKTDEEIAKEDKEQLEILEKERLKQLREIEATKYGNYRSADDLDDGFSYLTNDITEDDLANQNSKEDDYGSSSETDNDVDKENENDKINSSSEEKEESGSEQSNKENPEEKDLKMKVNNDIEDSNKEERLIDLHETKEETDELSNLDVEEPSEDSTSESSDEECAMDDLTDLMPELNDTNDISVNKSPKIEPDKSREKGKSKDIADKIPKESLDLPYVINVPDSYELFKNMISKHNVKEQPVIFERLIKSNHPSLDPGNKRKMLRLAEYVIQLVSEGDFGWEALQCCVSQMDILKEFNREECCKMLVDSLLSKLDDFNSISPSAQGVKFLAFYILLFLKPQGMDVLLPVNKPALSLACKVISQALSTSRCSSGLLCCFLLLQDATSSSTLYPEAVAFLHNCVKNYLKNRVSISSKKSKKAELPSTVRVIDSGDGSPHHTVVEEDESTSEIKHLQNSLSLLVGFVKAYRKFPQSKILFRTVHKSLADVKVEIFPPSLKKEVLELLTILQVLQSAQIPPLTKTVKKPKALRQYEPSFHTVTVGKSQRGLPAEKQEEQKLLYKYKHEMKGAMRELRRDRVFLANVKLRERVVSDEQRKRKVKEIFSSAATQQGELRSLKRKK